MAATGKPVTRHNHTTGKGVPAPSPSQAPAPRRISKRELAITLMEREGGATLAELMAATNWLPHSTRAIISGLRKDGFLVTRSKINGVSTYTISGSR